MKNKKKTIYKRKKFLNGYLIFQEKFKKNLNLKDIIEISKMAGKKWKKLSKKEKDDYNKQAKNINIKNIYKDIFCDI